jgi:hypothetical protein
MAKEQLIVEEIAYRFYIGWEDEPGSESIGGFLNQSGTMGQEPKDREVWKHWTACRIAMDSGKSYDSRGYFWDTGPAACAALAQIKLALKQKRPLPGWAKLALAAGWKPPNGWKA